MAKKKATEKKFSELNTGDIFAFETPKVWYMVLQDNWKRRFFNFKFNYITDTEYLGINDDVVCLIADDIKHTIIIKDEPINANL